MKQLSSINLTLSSENLADQINEIHRNRSLSDYDKSRAFLEIGVATSDLQKSYFFGGRYANPSRLLRPINRATSTTFSIGKKVFTFGVEIECLVNRYKMLDRARANNLRIAYESYNHRDNEVYYKFTTDASIHADNEADRGNEIECVSPVLKFNKSGLDSLANACKSLNEAGAKVNKSTGLHVHIGYKNMTNGQYINVFKNYQKLEGLIDSFMAPSRRDSQWCRPISRFHYEYCTTIHDVQRIMDYDRYHKVNPVSYDRHRTIEFRQHQGSTDYKKISKWVSFCAKLVAWSMDHVLTETVTDIDKVPFLNASEKAFFKARIANFARNNNE